MKPAQNLAPRTCPLCGGQFLPDESDERLCSDACREIAVGREPSQEQVEEAARVRQNGQPPADALP